MDSLARLQKVQGGLPELLYVLPVALRDRNGVQSKQTFRTGLSGQGKHLVLKLTGIWGNPIPGGGKCCPEAVDKANGFF